jgi:hypothetical protein
MAIEADKRWVFVFLDYFGCEDYIIAFLSALLLLSNTNTEHVNPVNCPMDYTTLPPMDFTAPHLVDHRVLSSIDCRISHSENSTITNVHDPVGYFDDLLHSQVRWYSSGKHACI